MSYNIILYHCSNSNVSINPFDLVVDNMNTEEEDIEIDVEIN
jgi:hypothetical protein